MAMVRRIGPWLCIILGVSACGTGQFYEGAPRPAEEIATFSNALGNDDARITAIDGRTLYGDRANVLPGEHSVLLHLTGDDLQGFELDSFCAATVAVQAGATYAPAMRAQHDGANPVATRRSGYGHRVRIRAGIEDANTHELVGRCECFSDDPYGCD